MATNPELAYLGEGDVLAIVDIADPSHIARLARLPLDMIIGSIEVVNGIAYVAGGRRSTNRGALKVVDVRDPLRPLLRGTVEAPGFVQGVAVADGYAYVASDNPSPSSMPGFFQAIDIRNPDRPTLRSTYAIVCGPTGWCGGSNGYPRPSGLWGASPTLWAKRQCISSTCRTPPAFVASADCP